ncbi:hypothetical protein EG835_00045 [bacterium]|nr:hypothetical protein [bacterium]
MRTKAVLFDAATLTVSWMNEAAEASLLERDSGAGVGMPAEAVISMTGSHDVLQALRDAAESGEARHLNVDLVSTGRGSMTVATSVYRLPDGMLLMLTDNSWQAKNAAEEGPRPRPSRRR